jgi:hypothetical protein
VALSLVNQRLAYFSQTQRQAVHRCAKLFEERPEEAKEIAMSDENKLCEARSIVKGRKDTSL